MTAILGGGGLWLHASGGTGRIRVNVRLRPASTGGAGSGRCGDSVTDVGTQPAVVVEFVTIGTRPAAH